MSAETDWLAGAGTAKPRATGGRKRTNGSGDRSRLLECSSCGFKCRTSAGALRASGFPSCGCGAGTLELANMRDRAVLDADAFMSDMAQLAPRDQNRIWRELGYTDMVVPLDSNGKIAAGPRSGAAQKRCQWEHGYCSRFVTGRYCPEHGNSSDRTYGERGA